MNLKKDAPKTAQLRVGRLCVSLYLRICICICIWRAVAAACCPERSASLTDISFGYLATCVRSLVVGFDAARIDCAFHLPCGHRGARMRSSRACSEKYLVLSSTTLPYLRALWRRTNPTRPLRKCIHSECRPQLETCLELHKPNKIRCFIPDLWSFLSQLMLFDAYVVIKSIYKILVYTTTAKREWSIRWQIKYCVLWIVNKKWDTLKQMIESKNLSHMNW